MIHPTDIISALSGKAAEGTPAERRLAALLLTDPDDAVRQPIAELARRAGVSEPSVTRLAMAIGLDGTRELKLRLAQAVAVGGAYLDARGETVELGRSRALATITTAAHLAIDEVSGLIDEAQLDAVAERLVSARHVLCFGTGGISSAMAQELAFRLFRFGLPVTAESDGRLQRMRAAVASPGTVLVGLSLSGTGASMVDAMTLAREYGAATAAITLPGSPLAEAAELLIPFRHDEDGLVYKPTSARFALLTIIDALALMTAERFGPRVVETMRRMKHALNLAQGYDPGLPLGD